MIPNLRDVGETINILYGEEILKEGVLYRGGTVNALFDESELPQIKTMINLRTGIDKEFSTVTQLHIPAVDSVENYQSTHHKVRYWLNQVISSICETNRLPLLIHCSAGKDRTGVVIAFILQAIGIDEALIIEEYLQSEGTLNPAGIETALHGFSQFDSYLFDAKHLMLLQQLLLT
ncbi:tyrosine-protein phosphatase [Celerinatantimonas sp. MCCC 1A17872]|uniref:tyrosine-protein phosphatase n=1 Tax=Celerinatantimonas sp. MCCC 1A17872 TaxID=3177514 RepID=UPI0038C28D26